ncbi:RagB/SusD family nutrient uptake outer membrane protein [Pedobacter hiemivivus]|uniref:RagB/SusD family nutrient uptake outer membrane protein n=1 Tax=Pedobacter hiemivivus TaxID=2530454 RepID=A0A4R0NG09_9SPHI|nr:RagB/SusD family nutrient uptake outer membrane protein [Pedobacter hiemivivus]TCC99460.1 RagB/SusD family nutrient uptake outer membrane protein [Pedobacter hiemivivus]
MKLKNIFAICLLTATFATGCKKYLEIPLPLNKISGSSAFTNDKSAAATISHILGNLAINTEFDGQGIGFLTGEYSDELTNQSPNADLNAFYRNAITSNLARKYWSDFYIHIYNCNLAIEGIRASTSLINYKNQWIGEALFLRALLHFYLTNIYGDVPLVTSSDFRINNVLGRTPKTEVYKQIIADLQEAQSLLSTDYRNASGVTTTSRSRPNKIAATALLARVYLYAGEWAKAEEQANILINDKANYELPAPAQTFLAASKETIWSFAIDATTPGQPWVKDYSVYFNDAPTVFAVSRTLPSYGVTATLSPTLVSSFESTDQRLTTWASRITTTPVAPALPETHYLVTKYKSKVNGVENIVMLRLAEQYLIRAEARAQQNNLIGANAAQADINAVRSRAGLTGTAAVTKVEMLESIAKERRTELFTEVGHRFFDLKRTGTIDAVMSVASPLKGGIWTSQKQIWPIPTADINANPNLTQAPGYN